MSFYASIIRVLWFAFQNEFAHSVFGCEIQLGSLCEKKSGMTVSAFSGDIGVIIESVLLGVCVFKPLQKFMSYFV